MVLYLVLYISGGVFEGGYSRGGEEEGRRRRRRRRREKRALPSSVKDTLCSARWRCGVHCGARDE